MRNRVLIAASATALALMLAVPATLIPDHGARAQVAVGISVTIAPPPLPIYDQPPLPGLGYIWIPGYWAWDPDEQDYYWVPGVWVQPPQIGYLWTPPYWAWSDGVYVFNAGYWGPTVGFYGGIDYGFGYTGDGYYGCTWENGALFYNSAVTNIVNVHITNVYVQNVTVRNATHISFNGGPGGVLAKPTSIQLAAARGPHAPPTAAQSQNLRVAQKTPTLRLRANNGQPPVAGVVHPGVFSGAGVMRPHGPGAAATGAPPLKPIATPPGMKNSALPPPPNAEKLTHGGGPPPRVETKRYVPPQPRFEAAPRTEPRPYIRPQPRFEAAPRIESRPYIRPQPRFEAAPRMESRPYVPSQPRFESAPRMEPRPYVPPQPRFEGAPRMESRPYVPPQPRFEAPPRAMGPGPGPQHFAPAPRGPSQKCSDPRQCR